MKTVDASKARRRWSHVLGHVHYTAERILIVRHDQPVAALVHPQDVLLLEQLADEADIDEARRALAKSRGEEHRAWPDVRHFARLDP